MNTQLNILRLWQRSKVFLEVTFMTSQCLSYQWDYVEGADCAPHKQVNSTVEFSPCGLAPWWWRPLLSSCDSRDTRSSFCRSAWKHDVVEVWHLVHEEHELFIYVCVCVLKDLWTVKLTLWSHFCENVIFTQLCHEYWGGWVKHLY